MCDCMLLVVRENSLVFDAINLHILIASREILLDPVSPHWEHMSERKADPRFVTLATARGGVNELMLLRGSDMTQRWPAAGPAVPCPAVRPCVMNAG